MSPDRYEPQHEDFRALCREFLAREVLPHHARWEKDGIVSREVWRKAGAAGLLGIGVPTEYGGGGESDFRFPAVFSQEIMHARATAPGFVAHNDVIASYLAPRTTDEQKKRWLPGLCAGETIAAIAMSEPDAGSNVADIRTTAHRDGDTYLLNGTKSFITNGENADLIVVAAKTAPQRGAQGISFLAVERGTPGFTRGRRMDKLGWHASDTCELFFDDCRIPAGNLIGKENAGLAHMMAGLPRERLSIATVAVAAAQRMLTDTLDYARTRQAFGQNIGSFQHNRFQLATMDTEITIAQVYLDHCISELNAGRLSVTDAAKAKWWTTELQVDVAGRCLQLHGGFGYLKESAISREWTNSRVQTIYGGTTEVMKELIGRSLGL
ncbi:acyl-CoA dehydrogenase family protein [Streptomyces pinistramenti]|uniref:acyl-CoA dehydrogenase family protein n=1 Tax=Streptomyces pinistramenti TaxID=2884812 RepID=UPI001D077F31|nr:acyl-CoA dehydrogenase family protein [Streptomyces pinistramenti]MCB5910449.1 acyl-CoA dehydrogenase family protein [Streptomyces pinistramenti]